MIRQRHEVLLFERYGSPRTAASTGERSEHGPETTAEQQADCVRVLPASAQWGPSLQWNWSPAPPLGPRLWPTLLIPVSFIRSPSQWPAHHSSQMCWAPCSLKAFAGSLFPCVGAALLPFVILGSAYMSSPQTVFPGHLVPHYSVRTPWFLFFIALIMSESWSLIHWSIV